MSLATWALGALGAPAAPVAAAPPPTAPAQMAEVFDESPRPRPRGGSATLITAGLIEDLDPNTEVRGPSWYGEPGRIGIGPKMLRDWAVRQSVEVVISPLVAGDWGFRPASDSPLDREVAAYCDYAFLDCLPWARDLRAIVRGYVTNGFHLVEMTDDYRQISAEKFPHHPGGGRGIVPTSLSERPAWSVTKFRPSSANPHQLASVQQYLRGGDAEPAGYVDIPADRLLRFTWDQDGANFAGLPILRSAFGPWKQKLAFQTISAIFLERYGVGLPYVKLGENAAKPDIESAEQLVQEIRSNDKSGAVIPFGHELDILEAKSQGTALEAAIARCDIAILMNVGAGFMMLSLANKTGSNALAGTQQGQHHLGIVGHGAFVCSVLNHGSDGWSPVERIVRLNYGPNVGVPKLEVRHLPTRDWESVITKAIAGIQAGAITADDPTEDEIRRALQLNPRDPDTARPRPGAGAPTKPGPGPTVDTTEPVVESDPQDEASPDTAPDDAPPTAAPDDTTPKSEQTIFGYHLQYGVAQINEARKNLNLPPVAYGDQTVPEYLESLKQAPSGGGPAIEPGADDTPPDDGAPADEPPPA